MKAPAQAVRPAASWLSGARNGSRDKSGSARAGGHAPLAEGGLEARRRTGPHKHASGQAEGGSDRFVALAGAGAETAAGGRCRGRCRRAASGLTGHRGSGHAAVAAGNESVDVSGKVLRRQHHFEAQRLAGR
ncbi:hypothetical protein CBM2637_B100029 [Cupriavidus taiwanensis]|nr:hypothetical protein CBM2637_B100029 [Cupriavidus taiwanensis]